MVAGQLVLTRSQRLKNLLVLKPIAKVAVLRLARDCIQVECGLVHATVLHQQHLLPLIFRDRRAVGDRPVGHVLGHGQRLRVAGVLIHVDHARKDLVVRVKRRPDLLMLAQPVIRGLWVRPQVAVLGLTLRQRRNQRLGLVAQHRVSRARILQRARRKVVADIVPTQLAIRSLPSTQRRRVGRLARRHEEVICKPIIRQRVQKAAVQLHRVHPDAWQQAHLGHRKGLRLPHHLLYRGMDQVRRRHIGASNTRRTLRTRSPVQQRRCPHCCRRSQKSSARQSVLHPRHRFPLLCSGCCVS